MFIFIPIAKESISKKTSTKYVTGQSAPLLFENKALTVIKDEYLSDYIEALKGILAYYKLDSHCLNDILYIIGQHLFSYSIIIDQRMDALEASELLLFLKNYHLQNQELVRLYPRAEAQIINNLNRTVEFKTSYPTEYPIKLHDIHFIAKGIYSLFKNQSYNHLKGMLEPYNDIPPIEVVNSLINKNQYIIDYPDRYFLAQATIDLDEYFKSLVPKVSNKSRLVFDVLFVSQLFHLNTKADMEMETLTNNNRFDLSAIRPTFKTSYINKLVKAFKIYAKRKGIDIAEVNS